MPLPLKIHCSLALKQKKIQFNKKNHDFNAKKTEKNNSPFLVHFDNRDDPSAENTKKNLKKNMLLVCIK